MSSLVKIEALGKDNYDTWKMQVRALLTKNDAWGYVSGEIKMPILVADKAETVHAVKTWRTNDEKAKSDLILSINPSELKQIKNCETSNEVWRKLEGIYQSKGPARKATLLKRLTLQRMGENGDIREHLGIFFDTVDKLGEMDVNIHPDLLAIMLLYSLPRNFENFRCAIESRDELPSPEALRIKILEESDARKSETRETTSDAMIVAKPRDKREFLKNKEKGASNNKYKASASDFKLKCYRCHRVGHKASECGRNRYSQGSARNASEDTLLALVDATRGAKALQANGSARGEQWCLDSGCTSHLCKDLNKFVRVEDEHRCGKLNLASSASTDINARGTVRITARCGKEIKDVNLSDTLHVPDLRTNLLSVSKITDRNYKVVFEKNRAEVVDRNGDVKYVADRKDGLYILRQEGSQNCKAVAESKQSLSEFELWHRRLGHLNAKDLLTANSSGIIPVKNSKYFKNDLRCEICLRGKMTKMPFPVKSDRKTELLEIVHTDVCGPMRVNSNGGAKYFVTFIDDYSKWCEVRIIKSKDEVFEVFKNYKALVETQTGKKIKCVQSDNGREYVNKDFDTYLNKHGIKRRLSVAYNPEQNGVAERKNRTLLETARCLLIQSRLNLSFWAEAVSTANYIRNRCPSKSLKGKSAFEKWNGKLPNLSYFKDFGCDVYYLDSTPSKGKFEHRSKKGIFVGYAENSKGYRIWLPDERKVRIARDVKFLENCTVEISSGDKEFSLEDLVCERQGDVSARPSSVCRDKIDIEFVSDNRENSGDCNVDREVDRVEPGVQDDDEVAEQRRGPGRPRYVFTGERGRPRKEYNMVDVGIVETEQACVAEIPLKQAVTGPDAEEWYRAIATELRSIIKGNTWELVERPKRTRVIGSRVVLRNKYKPDGSLERRKARIVARGFAQRPGTDFGETFAPVARLGSIRLMSALAVQHNAKIHQLDVAAAYLNGELEEETFMEIPSHLDEALEILIRTEGVDSDIRHKAIKMREDLKTGGKVCSMRKALYGLKQAGRCWHLKLDGKLREYGLQPSSADPCVYYTGRGEDALLVLVYVDDILISSRDAEKISSIKEYLGRNFEVKDLGAVNTCLGIEFQRSKQEIKLCQQGYIRDILERYGMLNCKPVSTPMEINSKLEKRTEGPDDEERKLPYRELMGSLMYLAVGTRPDIAHAVSALSQFNNCFGKTHWSAAKRVLRYLKGTATTGLVYRATGTKLKGFADASWGNCAEDRRSFTGYAFILGDASISWDSKKQRTVALSSTEAEYMAMTEATKEAAYIKRFLTELGFENLADITLSCDSQSALELAKNPVFHGRTKHIDIRHHFIRDALKEGLIHVKYMPTGDMVADILTKGLPGPSHAKHSKGLGLRDCNRKFGESLSYRGEVSEREEILGAALRPFPPPRSEQVIIRSPSLRTRRCESSRNERRN